MRLGRVIPGLIAASLVLDAGTRLIPLDLFAFRAWEVMVSGSTGTGPFAPNKVYANPMSYGDLAGAPEYAHLRNFHLEYFSTDAWGFRNPREPSAGNERPIRWMLTGGSFGVGSGVTDENSLARQLEGRVGARVYNAAAVHPLGFRDLEFTANRLGMREGIVVFEFMERCEMPLLDERLVKRLSDGPPAAQTWGDRLVSWRGAVGVSRLGILARWARRSWTADDARPEDSAIPVVDYRLSTGDRMLFLEGDVAFAHDANRHTSPDYLVWLNRKLSRRELRLVVLLVPNKYDVYGPHVVDAGAPAASLRPLQEFEESLRSRGVFVVNVADRFRKEAGDSLNRREYLYFPDDTHWNERGIAIAATALAEAIRTDTGQ